MKHRIIDNWKTTSIGVVILAISMVLLYTKQATWDQLLGFWTVSGLLGWVKDTIFKVKPDKPSHDTQGDN